MRKDLAAACFCCLVWSRTTPAAASVGTEAFKTAQRNYLRGSVLERRGDYAGALPAYSVALAADPESAYICRAAAELALEMGDTNQALQLARRLLELAPAEAKSHFVLGRALWAHGDTAGAEAAFKTALKLDAHSSEIILSLGSLLGERAPDQARDLLTKFIAENPDEAAEAHYQLAKIDFDAGRGDSAINHLQAGIALEPESLPLRYTLAQAYETRASTEAALAVYRQILQLDPGNVALIDHIGDIEFAEGDLAAARAHFEEAHHLQPSDPFSCQWLAAEAEKEGDWGRAADYLKASAALSEDPALNLRLSYYATQAGRLPEAVSLLEKAHVRWPRNDQVAYFLALGYDDLKSSKKSVSLLRQVLELKPGWREARYQLAAILEKLNRVDEAQKEFQLLLADKPDDASALNYLGYSLADRGLQLAQAEHYIREAVRLAPANAAYRDSLGWVLHKQGRSTEAVAELESAATRSPEDATVWDHLGDAQAAAGATDSAWLAWKRAAALAEGPAAAGAKADRLQRLFNDQDLGELYLEDLAAVHGRIAKLSAVCRVEGEVLGRRFAYDGMLTFKGPQELSLDLLGPLFVPLFRVRLGAEGFFMDAIRMEGVDPALIRQAIDGMFSSLREYFSGNLFALKPVRYRKSWWRKGWLEAGRKEIRPAGAGGTSDAAGPWRLELDPKGTRLAQLSAVEGGGRLALDDFIETAGHLVPGKVSISGPGYVLSIRFSQPKVEFTPDPGASAR